MKHPTRFLSLLAAAVVLVAAPKLHAQSWETIVDLSGAPSSETYGSAIMVDPFSPDPLLPDLFIGGLSADGAVLHVDQSVDPVYVSQRDANSGPARRLAHDSSGILYSAGSGWEVRRSTDRGVTWTTVDDAAVWNSSGSSFVEGLATDGDDNVYASGSDFDKRGNQYWVIRKGSNTGQNWTTSYRSAKPQAGGGGVAFVPPVSGHGGGLFAVGSLTLKRTTQWTVLRSRDSGASWQSVYAWGTSTANARTLARAITNDADGNIYVAGYGWVNGAVAPSWLVSRSRDGGQTWEPILQYPEPQLIAVGDYNRADDIAVDPWGNVYVVGLTFQKGSVGGAKWTVRRWDAATETWDNWPDALRHPMLPITCTARGVTTDAQGGVYVTGSVDGNTHWVVQRLVP